MTDTDTFDVFISYAHDDGDWVLPFAEDLRDQEFKVFLDTWEIPEGANFVDRLNYGLEASRVGLLVISPKYFTKDWTGAESSAIQQRTIEGKQQLLLLMLKEAHLPPLLAIHSWIDFRGAEEGEAYRARLDELVAALRDRRPRAIDRVMVSFASTRHLTLRLAPKLVELVEDGRSLISHEPAGLSHATEEKVWELWRSFSRRIPDQSHIHRPAQARKAGDASLWGLHSKLKGAGKALTEAFLEGETGQALAVAVSAAKNGSFHVALGLEVDPELARLPWETLRLPGEMGEPLALHPSVKLFRHMDLGPAPAM